MLKKYIKLFLLALGITFSFVFAAHADSISDLLRNQNDPVMGNPKGKVTVVEFFDYQCSHCVNMSKVMDKVIAANPSVRFVFKDYPIRGPISHYAALAAVAANKQGKYYYFSHALLARYPLQKSDILAIANYLGIKNDKLKKFQKDMESNEVRNQIRSNILLARELNLNGTPAFFIAKTNAKTSADVSYFLGEMSQRELQEEINKAKR